ncbi:pheromone-binding protein Gp-9-like [Harpegnathos saltator]|uniref:pheromone-binding protein Gp-9-like n=1 Tax=Harpegnathos saltator TaxID=610380 RepID=UPI00058F9951|nr:pheromone-binding protein Gp-9-like [Harpegnathos saltator]
MKAVVFCACILVLYTFSSVEAIQNKLKHMLSEEDNDRPIDICLTQFNMTILDLYTEPEIMNEEYTKPENEEKNRKNGCLLECLLKKQGFMEGSDINETKIHTQMNTKFANDPMLGKMHTTVHKCVKEIKKNNITQECEKGFYLLTCMMKGMYKAKKHDEHESEHEHTT